MPRTLSEQEFETIKGRVLASLPADLTEQEFTRVVGPRLESALAEAEYGSAPVEGSAVGRFLGPIGAAINPLNIIGGVVQAVTSPVETAKAVYQAGAEQAGQAKEAFGQGRYVEAAGRGLAAALPIVGPAAAQAGESIAAGDVAGGFGQAAALAAPVAAPRMVGAALKRLPGRVGPVVKSRLNPVEAEAVAFGRAEGVPLDLATATGSNVARAAQKRVANSIGGEGQAERMIASQEAALTRTGRRLTEEVSDGGTIRTPEQAGAAVTEGVTSLVKVLSDTATKQYDKLRAIEASDVHTRRLGLAPKGSPSYQRILNKLKASEDVKTSDLYRLRQIEAELASQPLTKRLMREKTTGGGMEYIEGTGSAGAQVYHQILSRMEEGGRGTRGKTQAALRKTLETGEWTPEARAALQVARQRQKAGYRGPSLPDDAALLGGEADVALPVSITPAKVELQPLYDQLKREAELVPLMGDKARALTALDRLMSGPEYAPVSVVDGALSDLKALARSDDLPELRTSGRVQAGRAVQALDARVKEAVALAGPEASQALAEGRAATVGKFQAGEVLKALQDEPVRAYRQMVSPGDSSIDFLRSVQEMAPQSVPHVGRAYLEDLMGKATAEGGFGRAAGLFQEWQRLGPETKALLFGPERTAKLDRFFLLAKRVAENPNPSGTAHVNGVFNWASSALSWPLAKLLYTERGVNALTKQVELGLTSRRISGAEQQARRAMLAAAARSEGVRVPGLTGQAADSSGSR